MQSGWLHCILAAGLPACSMLQVTRFNRNSKAKISGDFLGDFFFSRDCHSHWSQSDGWVWGRYMSGAFSVESSEDFIPVMKAATCLSLIPDCAGPLASTVVNRFNCRVSLVLAGLLHFLGLGSCYFITSFPLLYPALIIAGEWNREVVFIWGYFSLNFYMGTMFIQITRP